MTLLLLLACISNPGPVKDSGGDTSTDTADSGDDDTALPDCEAVEPEPPATRDTGDGPLTGDVLTGTITWTLAFDETAEGLGFTDCTYTRVYAENAAVTDLGWLCPDCATLTSGPAEMTAGYDDCYSQIDDDDVVKTELLGLGTVDGATHFFRSGRENVSLADMGAIVGTEDAFDVAWEDEADLTDGGTMVLSAAGSLTRAADAVSDLPDPDAARAEPYTCGWPQNSPGGPNSGWDVEVGGLMPNVRLDDQCDEAVDTWDFLGYYLVIDASSPDCGPCQSMASTAEAWKAEMEDRCVPVELVTMLNASLSSVVDPADLATRQAWAETFGLTSPVLADRGFAYAILAPLTNDEGSVSMPTILVVAPDGTVLGIDTGFGDWDWITEAILADWETRG